MDKLMALHCEEEREEQRFKETMMYRSRIFVAQSQIENMEKDAYKVRYEIEVTEPELFQNETDIKVLQTQLNEINKNIKKKLERVVKDENKVKKSKECFISVLRQTIRKAKEIQTQLRNDADYKPIDRNNEAAAVQKRIWTLQGEIEALVRIHEYQTKKIKEINCIEEIAAEHFPDLEFNM